MSLWLIAFPLHATAIPYIKPEFAGNTAIFPDRERLAKLEILKDLDRNQRRVLSRMWTEIKLK